MPVTLTWKPRATRRLTKFAASLRGRPCSPDMEKLSGFGCSSSTKRFRGKLPSERASSSKVGGEEMRFGACVQRGKMCSMCRLAHCRLG